MWARHRPLSVDITLEVEVVRERDSLVMQALGTAHGGRGVGWSGEKIERGVEGAKQENDRGLCTLRLIY